MPVASYWPLPELIVWQQPEIAAPVLDEDAFLGLLQNLLPRGRAWSRDVDANLTLLLRGLAKRHAAIHGRQLELLSEAFPIGAVELLPEWEETLGLPDPCAGADPSLAERQAHVNARLRNKGGQSVPYLIAYARDLGYTITITEFRVMRAGFRTGDECTGEAWAYALQVNAPAETITYLRADFRAGERVATWGNAVLECEIRRVAPGHAALLFAYG